MVPVVLTGGWRARRRDPDPLFSRPVAEAAPGAVR